MTYEILIIDNGHEALLLTTTDKKTAIQAYHQTNLCRLRVNGKMMLIHEADKLMSQGRFGRGNSWRYGWRM